MKVQVREIGDRDMKFITSMQVLQKMIASQLCTAATPALHHHSSLPVMKTFLQKCSFNYIGLIEYFLRTCVAKTSNSPLPTT